MENETLYPEYERWVNWMLEDLRADYPDWTSVQELSLRELYDMTYRFLDSHPQRRVLAMLVLNRLLPSW